MTGVCALCGRRALVQGHHLTRRATRDAPYFDPALRVPLCSGCHIGGGGVHQALRILGLDWLPPGIDPRSYRLLAFAVHCELFAGAGRGLPLDVASTAALAAPLREGAAAVGAGRALGVVALDQDGEK